MRIRFGNNVVPLLIAMLVEVISCNKIAQSQNNEGLPQPSPSVLQVRVRRVVLDVVVTGKLGEPIRGLSKEDFTIAEDGETQQPLSLDVHALDGPPSFVPPKLPSLPVNTFVNLPAGEERGPLYLILYDMVNIEKEDQPYARDQLLKFIRSKPAGTRFALLVATERLRLVQGFTDDPLKLAASLDGRGPYRVPPIFLYGATSGRGDAQSAVLNFEEIARYLAGLPGRKNVLWFAGRFPLTFLESGGRGATPDLLYEAKIKQIVNTMASEQIAVYPVDVRGVMADEGYVPAAPGSPGAEAPLKPGQVVIPNQTKGRGLEGMDRAPIASSYAVADEVGSETGGRAFYGSNDLADALRDATRTGGHYYTLTYAPRQDVSRAIMRHIHVTVSRPDCQLAYRRFYFADETQLADGPAIKPIGTTDAASPTTTILSPAMAASMQHGAPIAHDLVFVTHIDVEGSAALATPQQMLELARQPVPSRRFHQTRAPNPLAPVSLQSFIVSFKLSDAQLKPDAKGVSLLFAAASYDREGFLLSSVVQEATLEASSQPNQRRQAVHGLQQRILVPISATSLRLGVEDRLANRLGSLEIPLPLASEGNSPAR